MIAKSENSQLPNEGRMACPLCSSRRTSDFLRIDAVPAHVGKLCASQQSAQEQPRVDILLTYCCDCGYVFNRLFDDASVRYEPGYEVSLNHSANYRRFVDRMIGDLVEGQRIRGKNVVEVGCGTGYFLRDLCQAGQNTGHGFDPCVTHEGWSAERVSLVRDLYGPTYSNVAADLIVCRHVLQHISNPITFLTTFRDTLRDRTDTIVYIELPNGRFVFEQQAAWNVFYEHFGYFSEACLHRLFTSCGFEVLSITPCYDDDQYVRLLAKPVSQTHCHTGNLCDDSSATETSSGKGKYRRLSLETCKNYARTYAEHVGQWQATIDDETAGDARVVVWGSGGRGISFLCAVPATRNVRYVVDINPDRQGGYVPVSGQRVVAPNFLREYRPDLVVITNPTYEEEIREQLAQLEVSCRCTVI